MRVAIGRRSKVAIIRLNRNRRRHPLVQARFVVPRAARPLALLVEPLEATQVRVLP